VKGVTVINCRFFSTLLVHQVAIGAKFKQNGVNLF